MTKEEIMAVYDQVKPFHINEALYIIKERDPTSFDEKLTTSVFNTFYKKYKAEVEAMMAQETQNQE